MCIDDGSFWRCSPGVVVERFQLRGGQRYDFLSLPHFAFQIVLDGVPQTTSGRGFPFFLRLFFSLSPFLLFLFLHDGEVETR